MTFVRVDTKYNCFILFIAIVVCIRLPDTVIKRLSDDRHTHQKNDDNEDDDFDDEDNDDAYYADYGTYEILIHKKLII